MTSEHDEFQWRRHPEAEAWVAARLAQLEARLPRASTWATDLQRRTSSRLVDWIDHMVVAAGLKAQADLIELGWEREETPTEPNHTAYHHPGARLPRILLYDQDELPPGDTVSAAIQVEEVERFLAKNQLKAPVEGEANGPYRRATIWNTGGRRLQVVERRGYAGFVPVQTAPESLQRVRQAWEQWTTRPRTFADERAGMEQTLALTRRLAGDLGVDTAAWLVFAAERDFWESRNRAGQIQKARQNDMGLGWANHDHHTFRSSRECFFLLIQILETLGFRCRERFYAGAEAGWGAQVLEQPACRLAVFADVDLSPEEVDGDFAHTHLPPRDDLGTVGLWCALHGQSMLSAGLHHLACLLDFETATEDLAQQDVEMMRPFSDFSYLRQAFTRGERWTIVPERLERLTASGLIDADKAALFAEKGAIGSHLENIQRCEGFKGFNQTTISDIIRRTDPRRE